MKKHNDEILILGIETSCDETAAAVVRAGEEVLSNVISSQIDIHKLYGGVVPEIASRHHLDLIVQVVDEALKEAGVALCDIDAIAVTYGPGLVGALLVGISAAKGMAWASGIPLIGVNHIEGHIAANYLSTAPRLKPPYICLVVSGGHSHIVNVTDFDQFEVLGRTRDDAAGEAFDKVARTIGLGYPGGPLIDKAAQEGNPDAIKFPRVKFPDDCLDFSFSGVKTAVINHIHNIEQKGEALHVADIAASFQKAVVDVLTDHTTAAATRTGSAHIAIAGGVASNSLLRTEMTRKAGLLGIQVTYPAPIFCTDNAAMIAVAGHHKFLKGEFSEADLNAVPGLKLF
ncbi:MAG: tRNA (adenosine(37)-N6)-threonylcarbamoyltransferase complex transferase subunit TsaD [Clostridia bacterium]